MAKQKFIYRQYKGFWEHLPKDRYQATIESRLIQLFPKVEEELNITFSTYCEEELWDLVTDKINDLEKIRYDEQE